MSVERFQFGRPGKLSSDLGDALTRWYTATASLAAEYWEKAIPYKLAMAQGECRATATSEALAALPDPCVAVRIILDRDVPTILAMPRTLVLALAAALLGDAGGDAVTDRELTPVEETLLRYFLETFVLPALRETWPGPVVPSMELDETEPFPQWTRLFTGYELLVDSTLAFSGVFGEERAHWLVPQKPLSSLLGTSSDAEAQEPVDAGSERGLDAIVQELPLEIAVQLGCASISLSQLASLRVGDMVILGQQVSAPLAAYVGSERKLQVWAGRVGAWKAIQVESVLEST
jgi:flagellar motor switch protein FliM